MMHSLIEDRTASRDSLINGLFVPRKEFTFGPTIARPTVPGAAAGTGSIQALKNGYGFIVPDQGGPNMFFFHEDVIGADFLDLKIGDRVQYSLGQNDRGSCAKEVRRVAVTPG